MTGIQRAASASVRASSAFVVRLGGPRIDSPSHLLDDLEPERAPRRGGDARRRCVVQPHLAEPALVAPRLGGAHERAHHAAAPRRRHDVDRRHVAVALRAARAAIRGRRRRAECRRPRRRARRGRRRSSAATNLRVIEIECAIDDVGRELGVERMVAVLAEQRETQRDDRRQIARARRGGPRRGTPRQVAPPPNRS